MYYLVVTLAWAVGVLSFAQFLSVDPAAADVYDGETTARELNVRSGPGTTHEVLTTLPGGTPVSILETDKGWTRIVTVSDHKALDGWVSGKYVELYEIALPAVASAGVGEEIDHKMKPLARPVLEQSSEVDVANGEQNDMEPSAEVEMSEATESHETSPTEAELAEVAGLEEAPLFTENLASEQLDVQQADVEQTNEPASLAKDQVVTRLDENVGIEEIEEQASDAQSTETGSAESADVRISNLVSGVAEPQPVLTEPADPLSPSDIGPLTFEALDIACRKGYFSDTLEACVTDIKIDVKMPEIFAGLSKNELSVKCDVGYNYEVDGNLRSETTSEKIKVVLEEGQGSAVLESRIDFLFRVDGVSRVELADVSCEEALD